VYIVFYYVQLIKAATPILYSYGSC